MLSGSVPRPRLGALVAHFSIPFMLFSAYSLYALAEPSLCSALAVMFLAAGFSISPVAHVAYYYVGTLCKKIFAAARDGVPAGPSDDALVNEYTLFLNITWGAAIGITALGWAAYTILILLGRTALPPLFFLFTPLIVSPIALLLTSKLGIGRPHLNGARFNVGLTAFLAAALMRYLL